MFEASMSSGDEQVGGAGGGGEPPHVSRDWREVDQRMRRLAARRAALDVEEARMLMIAKRMKIHRFLGYGSFGEYIEKVLGYASNTGRDRVRVAEEIETMPAIAEAWEQGQIPYSVVREITRIATPETEEDVLAYVDGLTVREVVWAMRGLEKGDDPSQRREPEIEPRQVHMELPPDTYALFIDARRKLERDVGRAMTDAEFMAAACGAVLGGGASDLPENVPPHQVSIVVCQECKRSWHDVPGQSIEVPATTVERALCDALVLGRVDSGADLPPDPTRTIPAPTRRAVLARDHHRCSVPGCTMSIYVDVHHVDPFSEGGSHSMMNLLTLCSVHHALHHDGVITISGRPGAIVVTHADGRPYGAAPDRAAHGGVARPAAPPVPSVANGREPPDVSRLEPPTVNRREPPDERLTEARLALTGLGFKPAQAKAAVERAATHMSRDVSLEEVIRAALAECRPPTRPS